MEQTQKWIDEGALIKERIPKGVELSFEEMMDRMEEILGRGLGDWEVALFLGMSIGAGVAMVCGHKDAIFSATFTEA